MPDMCWTLYFIMHKFMPRIVVINFVSVHRFRVLQANLFSKNASMQNLPSREFIHSLDERIKMVHAFELFRDATKSRCSVLQEWQFACRHSGRYTAAYGLSSQSPVSITHHQIDALLALAAFFEGCLECSLQRAASTSQQNFMRYIAHITCGGDQLSAAFGAFPRQSLEDPVHFLQVQAFAVRYDCEKSYAPWNERGKKYVSWIGCIVCIQCHLLVFNLLDWATLTFSRNFANFYRFSYLIVYLFIHLFNLTVSNNCIMVNVCVTATLADSIKVRVKKLEYCINF